MANVNRPNGLRLVKTKSGAPISALVRVVPVTAGANIFRGDPIVLSSGGATVQTAGGAGQNLGVAIGFGKKGTMEGRAGGPFNPDDLMTGYFNNTSMTAADYECYYIPGEDGIFEIQTDGAVTLVVGNARDLVVGAGSTTTGISTAQIANGTTTGTGDLMVVEIPDYPDNDPTLAYGRYFVKFTNTQFNNG